MNSPPLPQDQERFRALYDATYEPVLRFIQRRIPEEHRAEDVTHETFLVAWRRLDTLPDTAEDARAWLFGVARKCLLAEGKSRFRRTALSVRLSLEVRTQVSDEGLGAFDRAEFAQAWNKLRPAEQEALALALWDDISSADAARILHISTAAYRTRLNRARTSLRHHLDIFPPAAPTRPYLRTHS